jgi:hypothetical protein
LIARYFEIGPTKTVGDVDTTPYHANPVLWDKLGGLKAFEDEFPNNEITGGNGKKGTIKSETN